MVSKRSRLEGSGGSQGIYLPIFEPQGSYSAEFTSIVRH